MPLVRAAANILDSYAFQLSVRGGLPARLGYVTRYWARYLAAKHLGGVEWAPAHHAAMNALAQSGQSRRTAEVELPSGVRLELDLFTCFMILKEIVSDGTYGAGAHAPRAGQVVFDVGGQQGVFTVLAARAVGPEGRVVAVEPAPENFARLSKNVALNGLTNVTAVPAALSDAPGKAELALSPWNAGGHSMAGMADGSTSTVTVELETLDSLCARLGTAPDLLKVDVEGAEVLVLRGGLKTLREKRPAVIVEADAPGVAEGVKALLTPLGYTLESDGHILFAAPEPR